MAERTGDGGFQSALDCRVASCDGDPLDINVSVRKKIDRLRRAFSRALQFLAAAESSLALFQRGRCSFADHGCTAGGVSAAR